jgi:hypothetical protein
VLILSLASGVELHIMAPSEERRFYETYLIRCRFDRMHSCLPSGSASDGSTSIFDR